MSDVPTPSTAPKPNLGGKVGGVPMYVWAIGIGLVLGLYMYRRKKASTNQVAVDSAGSPIATGAGGALDQTGGVGSGAGGWLYQTPTTASQASAITDNNSWYQAAMSDLLAKNYSPALADSALRQYLAAQALDANQLAIVNIALHDIGALPDPLPPSGQTIPPVVPPSPVTPTPPIVGGFTGGVGDHVSTGTTWGAPLGGGHSTGSWGSP